ncbi:diiron oxygenase [Pseudovibrio denitrificans]|uniref:diiron oxygenase n=1 Tax=Pseudovibrio denitrificans TaxID=258256 RepID=UPI0039BFA4D9
MQINSSKIDRLMKLSLEHKGQTEFNWPVELSTDRMWCDEDLLTTYGTSFHDKLSYAEKCELSKWEAINFFSLNVHGIKDALKFVADCIYESRYIAVSEYLHVFMAEENDHMRYFAKFCLNYANTIYDTPSFLPPQDTDSLEKELYMFASTLIFEEFVDFYNHKVGKNDNVPKIIKEINHSHHVDESRHVSFGRHIVLSLFEELAPDDAKRVEVSNQILRIVEYFVGIMYNSKCYDDARVFETCGFSNSFAMRNALRNSRERETVHHTWFKRTLDFFSRNQIICDSSNIYSNA